MRVLTVNTGSSTLKLRLVTPDNKIEATLDLDPWDGSIEARELSAWLHGLTDVDAVGYRVVHGGNRFTSAVRIDDEVLNGIAGLTSLTPLHQPRALSDIDGVHAVLPDVRAVACFDTAFHATMPPPQHLRPPGGMEEQAVSTPLRLSRALPRLGDSPCR